MHKKNIQPVIIILVLFLVLAVPLFNVIARALTAVAPSLGTAESYAVLGATTVTNTGASVINGNLGVAPGTAVTGFPPGIVVPPGVIHAGDAAALQAQADALVAYNNLAGQACDVNLTGIDLGGLTLTPGVYCFDTSAQLTGTLTLDAQGNPNSVFIFQIGSTLTTATNSVVNIINAGSACNLFWQVGTSATIGTTTDFQGTIIANTSVSLNTGADIPTGRAIALNGAVTMDTNAISMAACLLQPTETVQADTATAAANTQTAIANTKIPTLTSIAETIAPTLTAQAATQTSIANTQTAIAPTLTAIAATIAPSLTAQAATQTSVALTNTATNTATSTETSTPTNTATNTATSTETSTPTNTATNTATHTATSTGTITLTHTATNTATITPTGEATETYTATPTRTRIARTRTVTPKVTRTKTKEVEEEEEEEETESTPEVLPGTGFAPNQVTVLSQQPAEKAYTVQSSLWLEIPRLDVKMNIVGVPQTDGEWDITWLGDQAGWLNGTAFPTWAGNSVLTGHVYDADGKPGPFEKLNTLMWGDKIIIHGLGGTHIYEVRQVSPWVRPGAVASVIKHENKPWVTLITCSLYDEDSDSYKYRVVVRSVLVEVK